MTPRDINQNTFSKKQVNACVEAPMDASPEKDVREFMSGRADSQLFVPKDWSSATSEAYPDSKRPIQNVPEKEYSSNLVRQFNLVNIMIHNTPMSAPLMRAWQAVACAIARDGNDLATKKFTNEPGAFTWVEMSDDDSASADEEMELKPSINRATSPTPTSRSASPRDDTPTMTQKNQALPTKNTKPAKRYPHRFALMNKNSTEDTVASANLAMNKKSNEPSLNKRTISQMTEPQANTQDSSKKSRPSAPATSMSRDDSPAPPAPVWGKDPEVEKLISSITVLATYPSALPVATWNNRIFVALLHRPALDLFRHDPADQAFYAKRFLDDAIPDDKIEELLELGACGLDYILEYIQNFRDQVVWTVQCDRSLIPKLRRIEDHLTASIRLPWIKPPPSPSDTSTPSPASPAPGTTNLSSDLPAVSLISDSSTSEVALPQEINNAPAKISTEDTANTAGLSETSRPTSILRDDSPPPPAPVYGKDPEVEKLISTITILATYQSAIPIATWNHPLAIAFLERPALDTSPLKPEDQALNLEKFLENVLPDDKIEELLELGEYGLDSILEYIKHFRDQGIWTVSGDRLLIPTLHRIQEYLIASIRLPWLQPPPSPSKSPNCSQSPPALTATNTSADLPAASLSSASSTPDLALPEGIQLVLDRITHLESLESSIRVGQPNNEFAKFFGRPYLLPPLDLIEDKGLWQELDGQLTKVIGSRVIKDELRKGEFGASGLLPKWIKSARAHTEYWSDSLDKLIIMRAEQICQTFEKFLINPANDGPAAPITPSPPNDLDHDILDKTFNCQLVTPDPTMTPLPTSSTTQKSPARPSTSQPSVFPGLNRSGLPTNNNTTSNSLHNPTPLRIKKIVVRGPRRPTPPTLPSSSDTVQTPGNDQGIIPSQLTQITTTLSSKNLPQANNSLWIDPDNHKIDIQCSSIQSKKETTQDCVLLYDACSRMLRARLSASMTTYDPLERTRGNEILYFSKDFKLSQWVARDQTKDFFIAGCESPWGQDRVFNWNYIDLQSENSPSSNELEKRLCDSFRLMRNPTKHRLEVAGKFVLAAISLVGSEAGPLPPLHEFTEYDLPFVEVKDSFQCAVHYRKLQSKAQHQSSRNHTIEMTCVEKLTKLVDSIYGCIEALAVIRAHHHHQTQIQKFRNSQSDIDASFHTAASAVALRSQALTPLVAFLSLGFKGLLTYRRDHNRSNKTDLIQLCLVTGRMCNVEFSDEPVWKRASNYVLKSISKALFPKGNGEEVPSEWEHVTCRKYDLALAMYLDVSEHCRNSPVSDPKFPLYKLPVYENLTPEESETCY